jgi:hypothetical protein
MIKPTPLKEIAEQINRYLKKFEADPEINKVNKRGVTSFYMAGAFANGSRIGVRYISYQGVSHLTRMQAYRYLSRLNDGWVGHHQQALIDTACGKKIIPRAGQRLWADDKCKKIKDHDGICNPYDEGKKDYREWDKGGIA